MHAADQPARMLQLYPDGSQDDIIFQDHYPYPIWRDEEMHALLVNAALAAAEAIATSGRPSRTAQHVLLRVDIVLTSHGQQVSHVSCNHPAPFFVT